MTPTPPADRMESKTGRLSDVKRRAASTARWIKVLQDGLDGHPHRLGEGEGDAMEKCLAKLDIQFLSITRAGKRGLTLRRGAKPVVVRYYGAPIQRYTELFCEEQFKPFVPGGAE